MTYHLCGGCSTPIPVTAGLRCAECEIAPCPGYTSQCVGTPMPGNKYCGGCIRAARERRDRRRLREAQKGN